MKRGALWLVGLIILAEACAWSWGWQSGVASIRRFYGYIEGFNALVVHPWFGRFEINREDLRAIQQFYSFLGDATLGQPTGWPAQRSLYGLLLSGLWPLDFVGAAIALNLIFWLAALRAASLMPALLGVTSVCAGPVMALLVAFHQGMLWSIAEVNPHVAGYASGFLVLGVAALGNIHQQNARFSAFILVAITIGALSLLYHASLLYLPLLLLLWAGRHKRAILSLLSEKRAYRLVRVITLLGRTAFILVAAAMTPYLAFGWCLRTIGVLPTGSGTGGVLLGEISRFAARVGWERMPGLAAEGFLSAITSFGPILLPLSALGAYACCAGGSLAGRLMLSWLAVTMVALTGNFIAGNAGYAAILLHPAVALLSMRGTVVLVDAFPVASRLVVPSLLLAQALYVNAPLAGFDLPLHLGWDGARVLTHRFGHSDFKAWSSFEEINF